MVRRISFAAVALAALLSRTTDVQAGPMATQAFVDAGATTAGGGNIATATTFTFGDLLSTGSNSGALAGMSNQFLGADTFNLADDSSLRFGDSVFGQFQSTKIVEVSNSLSNGMERVEIDVLGNWTPGSYGGVGGGPYAASLGINFIQAAGGEAISSAAAFSVPPAFNLSVPEPGSEVLLGVGILAVVIMTLSRRRKGLLSCS